MPNHQGKLRKQQLVIACLLEHPTLEAASRASGVGPETICRWMREDKAFNAEYLAARRRVVTVAVGHVQKAAAAAAEALLEIVRDRNEKGAVRVAAASKILDTAFKGIDQEDLRRQVEVIEEQLNSMRKSL